MAPIFAGRKSGGSFKLPVKIGKIFIAAGKSDFGNLFIRGKKCVAGGVNA